MLTQEENDFLTRCGPGTPAGTLLRRYWLPVATHDELSDEAPTRFVRVLGEDLVLFRDKQGRVGLLADHCAHRGASSATAASKSAGSVARTTAGSTTLAATSSKPHPSATTPSSNTSGSRPILSRSSSASTGPTSALSLLRGSPPTTCGCAPTATAASTSSRS